MGRLGGFPRHAPGRTYRDRREAGQVLAEALQIYRGKKDLLVLGLPRGGVPVAWEVAAGLRAPLDVFVVRKLGAPRWPELALGALASGGGVVRNDEVVRSLRISDEQLQTVIDRETEELERRERAYRGGRPALELADKIVILVDDGIATGASMTAAVRAIRAAGPAQIVVAVPVAPPSAQQQLVQLADDVVMAAMPSSFMAVGEYYDDFRQTSDDEVRELLHTPTIEATE
ncbi:phosphoribosyltransferase [Mycobacterium sp.]|jgi:predicted phosphoribosyltransferase|uniref:phosphoribosyltransferase n=1 Tax=Mycobacterium sp. TaxID=1785 RepID=UPI002D52DDCD|nr:phosphoribosyltransferase [Mycobacterium sp.]HZA12792.1 phosphoribosyltransferase [Mycobacterium sp.]